MKPKHSITIQQNIQQQDKTIEVNSWVNAAQQSQVERISTKHKTSKKIAVHFAFSKDVLKKR